LTWHNYLFAPGVFFAALSRHPYFGISLLLWLGLTILFAGFQALRERLRGQINRRSSRSDWQDFAFCAFLGGLVLALLSFCAFCLLALLGASVRMEQVVSGIVFASFPLFLGLYLEDLRALHWRFDRPARVLFTLCAVGTGILLWTAFTPLAQGSGAKAFAGALPVFLAYGVLAIYICNSNPVTLRALYPWRMQEGDRVRVYYPAGKSDTEITQIVRGCDAALRCAEELMGVKPLPFKVGVFLFPDNETLHKRLQLKKERSKWCSGYAYGDAIVVPYNVWEVIRRTVAHEFGHVLMNLHVTHKLYGLLDEGLACYMGVYVGGGERNSSPPPTVSWRTLAHPTLFFEWRHVDRPEYTARQTYGYAASVATFLIARYGMDSYLKLCRKAVCAKEAQAGEQLAKAVQEVYCITVEAMERNWRDELCNPRYDLRTLF